jgi:hypothetical protein
MTESQRESGFLDVAKSRAPFGPLHADAPDHPKVFALAGLLGLKRYAAFGLVAGMWARALQHTPSGSLGSAQRVAFLCGWPEEEAEALQKALVEAGFIRLEGGGALINDWGEYGGRSLASREDRVARFNGRGGARETTPAGAARAAATGTATAAAVGAAAASDLDLDLDLRSDPDPDARATPTEPLGAFGEVAPRHADGVLAFEFRGETLAVRFRRDFPDFTADELRRHVENAWAHRGTLDGYRLRSWSWPAAAIARIDSWLRTETTKKLQQETARARAAQAGAHVTSEASRAARPDGISAAVRTRYAALRRDGVDLPPIEEFARRQADFEAKPPDEPAPDIAALITETAQKVRAK